MSASPIPPAVYPAFLLASPKSVGYCRWLWLEPAVEGGGLLWFFPSKMVLNADHGAFVCPFLILMMPLIFLGLYDILWFKGSFHHVEELSV